jgi:hypothetical protein
MLSATASATAPPQLSPQQIAAAAKALGLNAAPDRLTGFIISAIKEACVDAVDIAVHGKERNMRGVIEKALLDIASSPEAAANVFRTNRPGIMGTAITAVQLFFQTVLDPPGSTNEFSVYFDTVSHIQKAARDAGERLLVVGSTSLETAADLIRSNQMDLRRPLVTEVKIPERADEIAAYFDFVVRAQKLARETASNMTFRKRGRYNDLVLYPLIARCIDAVDELIGDLRLPEKEALSGADNFACDTPLLPFTRCVIQLSTEHVIRMVATPNLLFCEQPLTAAQSGTVSARFRRYQLLSDSTVHGHITKVKKAPRLPLPLLAQAMQAIAEAAKNHVLVPVPK